ncbi:MAG: hypothetical protein IKW97_07605 [Muribaculaceae bacterium]|nr:hypothetical protein [Muribaculaceae bacterium]
MFIYTYTDVEGSESQRVAGEIDHIMKPAFGDRPGVNGRQGTGPRLSARMLQEYEAARNELINGIITDDMVELVDLGNYGLGMNVKSSCGLTLCHAVQGNAVTARLDIEDLHYHQQWSGAPMEVIDRSRVVEASRVFLEHAAQWREQIAAAFKADSKGVKMRNMAMNNMDAYLERYFDGTGITYYFDKRHVDGHKSHLWVRLNAYKTLDLPIPHDDFINHLDLVKPHMVEFAYMARDGRFTVRGEVRDDWQVAPAKNSEPVSEQPRIGGIKGWMKRLLDNKSNDKPVQVPQSPLQRCIDDFFQGKRIQYHLTEDEENGQRLLHIRLNRGRAMVIDLNKTGNIEKQIQHDLTYVPRLVELANLFPYRLTGPRKKAKWITSQLKTRN